MSYTIIIKTAHFLSLILFFINEFSFAQTFNTQLLDSFINNLTLSNKGMGCLLISKNNKPIYKKSFGYKYIDVSNNTPNNINTKYLIGSSTKMFTAIIIYQLIEEGKISLEDNANKYIKEVKSNSIKIKHLLNHSSGLYDYVNDANSEAYLLYPVNRNSILQKIGSEDLFFKPGTKIKYCNSGYFILAMVIERVTGLNFSKAVELRITNKLGLENTFSPSNEKINFDQARSYAFNPELDKYSEVKDYYLPNIVGTGNIVSTTEDMSKFITSLNQGELLSPESFNLMKKISPKSQFGSGIMEIEFDNKFAYGHGGDTKGTHSGCFYFPHDSVSVTYFLNTSDYSINNFAIAALSILYNDTSFKFPLFDFKAEKQLINKFYGTYKNEKENIELKISSPKTKGAYLVVTVDSQKLFFEATGPYSFKNWKYDLDIRFLQTSGDVIFYQNGDSLLLNKPIDPIYTNKQSTKK